MLPSLVPLKEKITQLLPVVLIGGIIITQFIDWKLNNVVIVTSLAIAGFIYSRSRARLSYKDAILFLPTLLFILYAVGLFWATDVKEGWKQVESKMAFVGFPLLFLFLQKSIRIDHIKIVLYIFVATCWILSIICYVTAAVNIVENQSFSVVGNLEREYYYYSYLYFTSAVGLEPIYFSLYVNFCIVVLITEPIKNRWINYGLLIYFFILNFFIASKIGIICLVMIVMIYLFFFIANKYIAVLSITVLLVTAAIFISQSTFLRQRFLLPFEFDYRSAWAGDWNSISQRLAIWSCAKDAVAKRFPSGYGTSDGQVALNQAYVAKGYIRGVEDKYNVHNEYLYTALDLGLIGLGTLVIMILLPIISAHRYGEPILFYFQVLLALYFATEVILVRRQGVFFYSLFYCLLNFRLVYLRQEFTALKSKK